MFIRRCSPQEYGDGILDAANGGEDIVSSDPSLCTYRLISFTGDDDQHIIKRERERERERERLSSLGSKMKTNHDDESNLVKKHGHVLDNVMSTLKLIAH